MSYDPLFDVHLEPSPTASLTSMLSIVTFLIGKQEYGLLVTDVVEVVAIPAMVTLTGPSIQLAGLLNRRGQHIPVLDGRALIGESSTYDLNSQVIIARQTSETGHNAMLGLLVDQVWGVRDFVAAEVTPLQGSAAPFLYGLARDTMGTVLLLDLSVLLGMAPDLSLVGRSL